VDRELNRSIWQAAFRPLVFVVLLFSIKGFEELFTVSFSRHGVLPRSLEGIPGIVLYPFIHGDWKHVANNSAALLVLGTMMFHFYHEVAVRSILWMFILSGLWLWIGGRPNYHIGASGMVYALFGFLFLSGILRKHLKLMALSMLVVFLYGSLVWGIFPMEEHISWEGHLFGLIAGMGVALAYRDRGPQRPKYSWDLTDEEEMPEWYVREQERLQQEKLAQLPLRIKYLYKKKIKTDGEGKKD
jgi:membrane associated rhomboid family serine protease